MGHIHIPTIKKIDQNIYIGRPGHLYSWWDGDGKAWPVGAIIGEFIGNDLKLSWHAFPGAQTVRLFIDPYNGRDQKTLLVIENCPIEKARKVNNIIEGEWIDQKYRGIFRGYLDLKLDRLDLGALIKKILQIFINEIFVTPSDSHKMKKKYGYNRGVFTAKTLLSDPEIFIEYLERIVKASNKTQ